MRVREMERTLSQRTRLVAQRRSLATDPEETEKQRLTRPQHQHCCHLMPVERIAHRPAREPR